MVSPSAVSAVILRQAGEDIRAGVQDGRGFAVHEAGGVDDVTYVNLPDALMAEALRKTLIASI